jgi:LacI family transcriptional regulator
MRGASLAVAEVADATLEVIATNALTVLEGRRIGQRIAERPPQERPDALFAANDLVAIGLLQALVMIGPLAVPDDIAIIGYDDIDFAAATVVPLSSVRQPSRLIGETAVRILLDESDDPDLAPERIVFSPELVARESTLGMGVSAPIIA